MSTSTSASEQTYTVPALEKGMQILEDLSSSPEPLSIIELATRQKRSRNEIYRMVSCLETLGYITREESTKRYSLSLKLFQMVNRHPAVNRLRTAASQPLQALAERINESCHLCVLDGDGLCVIAQASGNERIRIAFQAGARFDPLETCSGKLLLSELPEDRRDSLLENSPLWQSMPSARRKSLLKDLGNVSTQRLWEEDSVLRPGVRDIAAALGTSDTIHATVTVAHLMHNPQAATSSQIKSHILETARDIQARLGIKPRDS